MTEERAKEKAAKESEFPLVHLISAPENPLKTIYLSCRTCYSADYPLKIWEKEASEETMLKLVRKVLQSGHYSTIEHCHYVFTISGVSRACTHQLVRHRHMSFSQKSQRYVVEEGQFEYITPATVVKSGLQVDYDNLMTQIAEFYDKMIESGIPAEDARFILPNAATSSMVASLNLREMIHVANLRLCTNAQHEIRKLVKKMCELVIQKEPWLKDYLVPKCERNGYCDEIRGCGRFPAKS
ncbi:MAG: FAD-dependent thymidylate synthase [Candidatus Gastranaerophilales bacterium]|nr:FAD-dependent thymidylate synthase [Candidatus Gastranaerophilales bacterium]